ncbi:MAG TPA: 3-phenylpropionate/cinnamic acid dioxygenase subunit beta [Bryobacteraceae bacterium]|nr:3-phenylpropionate/cinnamic acid dioxygenase subunit beta [Bryobacteraceae bacterium]
MREAKAGLELQHEVEQFFYREADLLDDRQFNAWLELFSDDVRYWMPISMNVRFGDEASELTRERKDSAWMDEGKETLTQRVKQIMTGIHWAEEPKSRMSHLITNVRIVEVTPDDEKPERISTRCKFLVYRNRLHDEVDVLIGKRKDTLRRFEGSWKICRREIYLDQNVLLAKNLTTFF